MPITNLRQANNRVVVGMSGGVDSAVAALLLQQQGFDVHGVTLKTWHVPAPDSGTEATGQAAVVATALHIPLTERDVEARFFQDIVQPFVAEYTRGLTPNPCVLCNPGLKFAVLLEEAERINARWIATGHYARVEHPLEGPARLSRQARLLQARDRHKDQTYALYRLTQRHLTRMRLPLGDIADKATVRDLARKFQLPVAEESESQDLCFMRGGDYRSLLETLRPDAIQPGPILDEAGRHLGVHRGLAHYTVGQRSGLGIAAAERLYVVRLYPEDNTIVVGPRSSLERRACRIEAVTFTAGDPPAEAFAAEGRIRYRAPLVPVKVSLLNGNQATVRFARAQMGVAPGQSLVFYRGEEVLGGGVIVAADDNV